MGVGEQPQKRPTVAECSAVRDALVLLHGMPSNSPNISHLNTAGTETAAAGTCSVGCDSGGLLVMDSLVSTGVDRFIQQA